MDWKNRFVAAAALSGLITGLFLGKVQPAGPSPEVREWIGALSGWAAAIGALFAALLTYPSLRKQAEQATAAAAEAKRQSDFLLGESEPEAYFYRSLENRNFLKVVNNNKRPFRVRGIIPADSEDFRCIEIRTENMKFDRTRWEFHIEMHLDGWSDRTSAPPVVIFELEFAHRQHWNAGPFNLTVVGQLEGLETDLAIVLRSEEVIARQRMEAENVEV